MENTVKTLIVRCIEYISMWFEQRAVTAFSKLASKRRSSVFVSGLAGFCLPAIYGLLAGMPDPRVHDEYSYLLAGDTFAHGRLTNPTHVMWHHFESPHILHLPSYMSKYPPGQGVAIALGQVMFGHPAYGIWLSSGFAAAAVCWMLQGWTRPRWALLGTLLMVMSIGIKSEWSQSYWGGMVAAGGGALALGGWRRIMQNPRVSNSIFAVFGLLILANSRPFEGAVSMFPAALVLFGWLISERRFSMREKFLRTILPGVIVICLGISWMLYYNLRLTGSALTLPYQTHHLQYARTPLFLGMVSDNQVFLGHDRLRRFYSMWSPSRLDLATVGDLYHRPAELAKMQATFFLQNVLLFSLIMLPCMFCNRWLVVAILCWCCLIIAMLGARFTSFAHYAAPITGVAYLLCVEGVRRLRSLTGRLAVVPRLKARYLLLAFCVIWCSWIVPSGAKEIILEILGKPHVNALGHRGRSHVIRQIEGMNPDNNLVLVKYDKAYDIHDEWVYNEADIDNSRIVWAHDLGEEKNQQLRDYFKDRRVWVLKLSNGGQQLFEYGKQPE